MKAIIAVLLACAFVNAASAQETFRIPLVEGGRAPSQVRSAPTYTDARVLAANVNKSLSVPTGTRFVLFSANCDFYARLGGTATVPSGDVSDGTASELNPVAWFIEGQSSIGLISAVACRVTASFYR